MTNNVYLFIYVSFLVLVIDFSWIQWIMKAKYAEMIPKIQKSPLTIRYIPVLLSYLTIILPIVFFSVPNIRKESRWKDSLFYGGLLGVFMYGMFSFTNYALIKNWTLEVVFLDTVWGGILYTIVSYIASFSN